jgi:hypothetical protein
LVHAFCNIKMHLNPLSSNKARLKI